MLYLEYEKLREAQRLTIEQYKDVLEEQEALFARTQPQGVNYGGDRVQASPTSTTTERYVEAMERARIDERKEILLLTIREREELLRFKKTALYASKWPEDAIYRMRILEGAKVPEIARKAHFSRAQTYRVLRKILQEIRKMRQNETNTGI